MHRDIAVGGKSAAIAAERFVADAKRGRAKSEREVVDFATVRTGGVQTFIGQIDALGRLGFVGTSHIESIILTIKSTNQQNTRITTSIGSQTR